MFLNIYKNQRMRFEFSTTQQIIFGNKTVFETPEIAKKFGNKALFITGKRLSRATPLISSLKKKDIQLEIYQVEDEPTITTAREALNLCRKFSADFVIGYGGGSVLDVGKAVAALITNRKDIFNYLEIIGKGEPLSTVSAPFIAIPTTSGTGSEVTHNSVLKSEERKVKVSLRSKYMQPSVAIIDPELTLSLPPEVTAWTGMDALIQLLESFVSINSNPITDSLCRQGLTLATRSLQKAYENGSNLKAREEMSLASLLGGISLANSKLGAVHGFAGPLGGMFNVPHGVLCAASLPHVIEMNILALQKRDPKNTALQKYQEFAAIATNKTTASLKEGIKWAFDICTALKIPKLSSCGLKETQLPELIQKASKASSMNGNPIKLTHKEMASILQSSL